MSAEWYYTTNKQQMGPVTWDDLRELANVGILKPHDLVWTDGMDEWVKAINQSGLFTEGAAEGAAVSKKSSYSEAKPPPGRRRRVEEEEDDDEEDEKETKRKTRKRQQERAKMAVGVKVGLILAGVLVVLLLLGCIVGILVFLAFGIGGGGGGNKGGGNKGGGNKGGIIAPQPKTQNFTIFNLPPRIQEDRPFTFQQGKKITITATSAVNQPQTDVDLYVMRGGAGEMSVAADVSIGTTSRVEFVVPDTDTYRVRIVNLGPGMATTTTVTIQER